MKVKTLALLAGAGGSLLIAGQANAGFTGLSSTVTVLDSSGWTNTGGATAAVFQIFANFDGLTATERRRRKGGEAPDESKRYPYLADEDLIEAVNMAIVLERPLLVKGPPGCGKTMLAEAVAHELNLKLYQWHVKSTSLARDGLYTIDILKRLQEAQPGR